MLDVDGDGLISLPEMLEAIKEAFAAREALTMGEAGGERSGRGSGAAAGNGGLERVGPPQRSPTRPPARPRPLRPAGTAAKVGRNIEVNDALERIRGALRDSRSEVKAAFAELDNDRDGCLSHMEAVSLVRRFLPGERAGAVVRRAGAARGGCHNDGRTPMIVCAAALRGADMYQKEVRYLLAKLQQWDVAGEVRGWQGRRA
jgi:hypothetical protein